MCRTVTLILSLVINLILLLLIFHIHNLITKKDIFSIVPLKRILFSKNYNNIKSGDIIYTRNSIASCQELIIPYIYKHIGIIIEFKNTLYIAETSMGGISARSGDKLVKYEPGVIMSPLTTLLRNNLGVVFLSRLNKPLTINHHNILEDTIINHYAEKYPSIIDLYIVFTLNIRKKINLYCHTFVYTCLKNMNLISDEKKSAYDLGRFITNISQYNLHDGYKYEYPKQLIYDYECNDEIF